MAQGENNGARRKTSDAEGGICFSCAINEKGVCEADREWRSHGLSSEGVERQRERRLRSNEKGVCEATRKGVCEAGDAEGGTGYAV